MGKLKDILSDYFDSDICSILGINKAPICCNATIEELKTTLWTHLHNKQVAHIKDDENGLLIYIYE